MNVPSKSLIRREAATALGKNPSAGWGELAAAKDLVDGLTVGSEPDGALEVLGMALELELSGAGLNAPNTATIERLSTLAAEEGSGRYPAQAWLRELGLADEPERVLLPQEMRALASTPDHDATTANEPSILEVYPVPADGRQPIYLVARLLEGMETGTIRIMDPLGREAKVVRVTASNSIVEVDPSGLVPGLYLIGLFADGVQVASAKFELHR